MTMDKHEDRSRNPVRRAYQDHAERFVSDAETEAALPAHVRMASEGVVVAAPMSFTGSTERVRNVIMRATGGTAERVSLVAGLILVLIVWWAAILCWYVIFGLLLVPYRLIRRGQRKRDLAELRHREIMSAMNGRRGDPPPAQ